MVPFVFRPDDYMIAVSGDPLRFNCYILVSNGMIGYPTIKPAVLPKDWHAKLKAAQGDRSN